RILQPGRAARRRRIRLPPLRSHTGTAIELSERAGLWETRTRSGDATCGVRRFGRLPFYRLLRPAVGRAPDRDPVGASPAKSLERALRLPLGRSAEADRPEGRAGHSQSACALVRVETKG